MTALESLRCAALPTATGLAVLLASCASSAPAPLLLTLPPALDATVGLAVAVPAAGQPGSAPLLAIRRVGIPEYLVSRRVRFRADASTLAEWPNTYWAERIEIGVSREFVAALRPQLPGWSLCDTTCGDRLPTLALHVELAPMDYLRASRRLQARALITLSSAGASPHVKQAQEVVYDLPATADTPQAHAQAITDLLRQVAAAAAPLIRNLAR